MLTRHIVFAAALAAFPACGGGGADASELELITAVTLTFTPDGGGDAITAVYQDPDGDGGMPPTVEPVDLTAGDFELTITFENRLEVPAEDITVEIADESDEHQIFLTGTAVDGPASNQPGAPLTHAYADSDPEGNPLGLTNSITAVAGSGMLTVTLRHLPPINGVAVKDEDLAARVSSGGLSSISGETDASITYSVTVQ